MAVLHELPAVLLTLKTAHSPAFLIKALKNVGVGASPERRCMSFFFGRQRAARNRRGRKREEKTKALLTEGEP